MKKLVAIMTCGKPGYIAKANAQRETWVPKVRAQGVDVIFFSGQHAGPRLFDEIVFDDVPDGYAGIPLKVKAICRWASERKYDYTSKVDDDVYVIPARYATLPLAPYDYIGRFRGPCGNYPAHFASGFFYTLSLRATKVVAGIPWNRDWMDERFVANSLAACGIWGHTDPDNYMVTGPFHRPENLLKQLDYFRNGTAYCQYGVEDMHQMHKHLGDLLPIWRSPLLSAVPHAPVSSAQLAQRPADTIPVEKLQRA